MKILKFVHCADIHLDSPFRDKGKQGYAQQRRNDIRIAFDNIIQKTKDESANLLLISGDLYEHDTVSKSTMEWVCMKLGEVGVPVVIIPGNHDPYLPNSYYKTWDWPKNVHILSAEKPELILEDLYVNIYGVGFSSFREGKPELSKVLPPKAGYFNILMFHGTLDFEFGNQDYHPVTSEELDILGYDYYALGHFHGERRNYMLNRAFNPGSPEPLGFDEQGNHGAYLVTLAEDQGNILIKADFFRTCVRMYHDITLEATGLRTLEEIKIKLLGLIEGLDPLRDIIRIRLRGRTNLSIDSSSFLSLLQDDWLYFKIIDETTEDFNLNALSEDPSIKGAFTREMIRKLKLASDALEKDPSNEDLKDEEEIIKLALYFGLDALSKGKIEWPFDEGRVV